MEKEFHEINFGPLASNVLDYVNKAGLRTRAGQQVEIKRDFQPAAFRVLFDGREVCKTLDNCEVSYFLNSREVGILG